MAVSLFVHGRRCYAESGEGKGVTGSGDDSLAETRTRTSWRQELSDGRRNISPGGLLNQSPNFLFLAYIFFIISHVQHLYYYCNESVSTGHYWITLNYSKAFD